MFEADQIRLLLSAASIHLRAMILLGVNCGMGNKDVAFLRRDAVDLENGWLDAPRLKTGVKRCGKLWTETTEAIQTSLSKRPNEKHLELIFVTKFGNTYASEATADSPITKEFRKLLDRHELHRKGLGFYTLRHVFETIAGESKDQPAADFAMGHDDGTMAGV